MTGPFDESLYKYKKEPGLHYFIPHGDTDFTIIRIDYTPGLMIKLARRSALARYLGINLNLPERFERLQLLPSETEAPQLYVGNTLSYADPIRVADSQKAVDYFLKLLPSKAGLDPTNIVFLVDGRRPHLYDIHQLFSTESSYFSIMREYFISHAKTLGYETIDMESIFLKHFNKYHNHFEFPHDNHWNGLGHKLAFLAIRNSKTFATFLGSFRKGVSTNQGEDILDFTTIQAPSLLSKTAKP